MALHPSAENFRAELARHMLRQMDVADEIGMSHTMFSQFCTGIRPLSGWAAHNIALGINRVTECRLFDVDETKGLIPVRRGRRPGYSPKKKQATFV